jgi:hypothetical protein
VHNRKGEKVSSKRVRKFSTPLQPMNACSFFFRCSDSLPSGCMLSLLSFCSPRSVHLQDSYFLRPIKNVGKRVCKGARFSNDTFNGTEGVGARRSGVMLGAKIHGHQDLLRQGLLHISAMSASKSSWHTHFGANCTSAKQCASIITTPKV